MNQELMPSVLHPSEVDEITPSTSKPFIEANTVQATISEMMNDHIIPVFVKDNETLISHVEFIESAQQMAYNLFRGETILHPKIIF